MLKYVSSFPAKHSALPSAKVMLSSGYLSRQPGWSQKALDILMHFSSFYIYTNFVEK